MSECLIAYCTSSELLAIPSSFMIFVLMEVNSPDQNIENGCNFFTRAAFRQHLQDLPMSRRQVSRPARGSRVLDKAFFHCSSDLRRHVRHSLYNVRTAFRSSSPREFLIK